ncbi:hypothetical protein EXE10_02120 [Acinetobacter sp. WCHAc060033]|uniref:hypothetical protein n=1 Tax=Acinetobacter sp. WCHAc060033 TaxID=2518624 RepID=UPI0010236785|nr:hypothetical protein [Acinetobacter sp. WCHAc060033]RZG88622.1 hypothetical protein EXE10_02120 [Acinetobacter sp. WCHAc060033]
MKLNISFDWAVLTSIFTFLLYWCGYCYYIGYLDFYGVNIDSFDIPVISLIIQGFISGYKAWITLIFIFLIISYVTSISLKQWLYLIIKAIGLIFNFFIILYNLTFYYPVKFIKKHSIVSKTINTAKSKTPQKVKNTLFKMSRFLKKIFFKIENKSRKIEESNHRILTRLNLTTPLIKKEVYGDIEETSINQNFKFDLSFLIHYTISILLLVGVISVLNIGQQIINEGKNKAEQHFVDSKKALQKNNLSNSPYPLVTIKGNKDNEKLFLTNICLKSMCVITNENKVIQIYDVKDLKIKNFFNKTY